MKIRLILCAFFAVAGIFAIENAHPDTVLFSKPVYVPNYSHESDHLSEATLQWDATMKTTNVPANTDKAHFVFYFTNVAVNVDRTLTTNVTEKGRESTGLFGKVPGNERARIFQYVTNIVWVTNSVTPLPVSILDVHPSCGCTTAQLPPMPWFHAPGTNGQIGVTVNLAGKFGTIVKTVHVGTDHGSRDLIVQITIVPQSMKAPTDAERIRQMEIARADRQAVFKGDCAACHEKPGQYKYGKALFDADCAICHEAQQRASMVPDLHHLLVPTNDDFWRTWIAHGKPGTFMPAFSSADGGPLNNMQIASLAAYLDSAIPSKVRQLQ